MSKVRDAFWTWLKWIAVLVVAAGIVGYVKFAPVAVRSHTVESGSIVAEVMGTGTLEARVAATISPKISGRIVEVLADQGQRVSKGELLVRLDDGELKQQVAIADANVEAAQAAIERLKTDRVRALAIEQQARRNNQRVQSLLGNNATSQDEADKANEALAVAMSGIARTEAAITEGQKVLIAAERTSHYHNARLRDTEIRAPFAGLIVKRNREPGDITVPGSSILTLISTDELWISAWVDETEISKLDTDQTARVVFRSESEKSYAGTVIRLGREADRETREFIVDIRVLELPKNWAVGQRAETFVQTARRDHTLILPASFLLNRDGQAGVFVESDGVAQWRGLKIGIRSRNTVEVLEGLSENETVVSPENPRHLLSDGRRISVL